MKERKRRHDDAHWPLQGRGRKATKRKVPAYTGPACESCGKFPLMMLHLCDESLPRVKKASKP